MASRQNTTLAYYKLARFSFVTISLSFFVCN